MNNDLETTIQDCHSMRSRHRKMDADLLARLARVRADFPPYQESGAGEIVDPSANGEAGFVDWELNRRDHDRKREVAHGLLIFVALIAIASLMGCAQDQLVYSPETQNAETLQPIAAEQDSLLLNTIGHTPDCPRYNGNQYPCVCGYATGTSRQRWSGFLWSMWMGL